MELNTWLQENKIKHIFLDKDVVEIKEILYYVFPSRVNYEGNETLFSSKFEFLFTEEEQSFLEVNEIENIVFEFGDKWFYSSINKVELKVLKYLGEVDEEESFLCSTYLGIHGSYEICNGSRDYDDWCKKAKFLKVKSLGLCEEHTLAGTLNFQMACKKNGIKSILGETARVVKDDTEYFIKLFTLDEEGWNNLLLINKEIKINNNNIAANEEFILSHSKGLVCVFQTNADFSNGLIEKYRKSFKENLFYQLDFVEWSSSKYDQQHLERILVYIRDYKHLIEPILICDSYYLDREDFKVKKILNEIGKIGFKHQSKNQYFKSTSEIIEEAILLFEDKDIQLLTDIIETAINNVNLVNEKSNFLIETDNLYLPEYELTEEESKNYPTAEDLFWGLINEGFISKIKGRVEDEQIYIDRIEKEAAVILSGNLHHYFLILYDIIRWCKENNILTGVGRGSAAGSIISYFLDITRVDPIKFDLLFERFLNEKRVKSGLPDIDTDFQSDRRDDVKRYMEERYGLDNVVSIGTYGTLKMRAAVKDLSRAFGGDFQKTNYISSIINPNSNYTELFKDAINIPVLKDYIQNNSEIFSILPLIIDQPKTESVHPAGIVITPKKVKGKEVTVYDLMPVKMMDGILVSEWEGYDIGKIGFLKEDILGIKQLQKFAEIIKLINKNHKVNIILEDIEIDSEDVFNLFKGGYNEDVFHFGAPGLTAYCRILEPSNIEDLTATLSLYRPGPIQNGIHKLYVEIKHGRREIQYDHPLLESILNTTFGLLTYQEQIMKIVSEMGGFTMVEADEVRSIMGKGLVVGGQEAMSKFQTIFVKGCIERDIDEFTAIKIWNKLELFAKYSFNRSHACVYAHTSYFCQWFKYNFPLEFWSVALNYSSQEEISRRIAELHKISPLKVLAPDINRSTDVFEHSVEDNEIYWSIGSIKFIGEKSLENIITERDKNGKFYSFTDFYNRIDKRVVNKRCIINLILSGCFDKVEKLNSPPKRFELLHNYVCKILGDTLEDDLYKSENVWKEYLWILKQKELTGYGYLNFKSIFDSYFLTKLDVKVNFIESMYLQDEQSITSVREQNQANRCVIGVLTEIIERNSKKGPFAQVVLNCNDENFICLLWSETWESKKELIKQSKNKIVCITGDIRIDTFRNCNILQTCLKTQIEVI